MNVKFQITLDKQIFRALSQLAGEELREPRAQASILIRAELERRGLLEKSEPTIPEKQAAGIDSR